MIAKAAAACGEKMARDQLETGCDCTHSPVDGQQPDQYVDHYCGYKREYPNR